LGLNQVFIAECEVNIAYEYKKSPVSRALFADQLTASFFSCCRTSTMAR